MSRLVRHLALVACIGIPLAVSRAQERDVSPLRPGRGPGAAMRADQEVFHFLLEHHAEIERSVQKLDNGVETLTESRNPRVAAKIQEHVAAMHQRVKDGRGLRFWDDLFVAIFRNYARITMTVEKTERGVRVRETSTDAAIVRLIQAHADVVSMFVARGFDEAHRNHPVPAAATTTPSPQTSLVFPSVPRYGGVIARPQAAEQPRAGTKVVVEATAGSPPTEVNKGLERAARLLNLYGAAGMTAADVSIAVVLHGEATKAALNDTAFQKRLGADGNPNLPLIRQLREAGVEVLVCGQALHHQQIPDADVADSVTIAASALTAVTNRQRDGYSYVLVP